MNVEETYGQGFSPSGGVSGEKAEGVTTGSPFRVCCLCGGVLVGRRVDARFCSDSHRYEAFRQRRLLEGESVDGCHSLAEYLERRQSRSSALRCANEESSGG
jgi:hypothetical protein